VDRSRGSVDPEAVELLDLRDSGRPSAHVRSPEQRRDPSQQLIERERLGDIVVGTELQPDDLVDLGPWR